MESSWWFVGNFSEGSNLTKLGTTFFRKQTGRGFDSPQLHKKNSNLQILINTYYRMEIKMEKHMLALSIVLITISNGFLSTKLLENKNVQLKKYVRENIELKEKLNEYETEGRNVTVTMYQPLRWQTDSTPNILADGTRIKTEQASNYKFIAVSRNLLKRWGGWLDYGDFILLKGTSHKDGVYQVKDTMNPRYVNRVDILESPGVKPYKFDKAQILKTDIFASSN